MFYLVFFPYEIFVEDLSSMHLINYTEVESIRYGFNRDVQAFRKSLKELAGSFIEIDRSENRIIVQFHNPSILDFMENFYI